jgi:tripartite-type tricarboxylate transporter receptor subunit TctC
MKRVLAALFATSCVFAVTLAAQAQEKFPNRPVRIITAFAPGSATDIIARVVGEQMRQTLGQGVIVENRPGAFGIIAIEEMARAKPDGHTVMVGNVSTSIITPLLFAKKFSINYEKDVVPVARVAAIPNFLLVTTKDFPPKTLPEFIEYAKARPGKLRFASSGMGSFPQYDMEILAKRAGLDMIHIPMKEGPPGIMKDMAAGDIQASFINVASSAALVKSGQLRPLAVVTEERLPEYPDVPTMKELGFAGIGTVLWSAMFAPAGTPPDVIDTLHAAVNAALASSQAQETFKKQLIRPIPAASVQETRTWLRDEMDKWVRITGEIKIDIAE